MQWWAWIVVGAILLGSELTVVNAQFYLVFLGVSALLVGAAALVGVLTAFWLQWLVFALLAVTSMFTFRQRIYQRLGHTLTPMKTGPAGEVITLPAVLLPGETCRLEYRGGSWSAINGGQSVIQAGAAARISRVDGLTLVVHGDA